MTSINFPTNPQPGDTFLSYAYDGEKWRTTGGASTAVVLRDLFNFSIAADDSTQRVISNNEVIKFIGAGGITTSSDTEGNITITQGVLSSLTNGSDILSLDGANKVNLPGGTVSIFSAANVIALSSDSSGNNYFEIANNVGASLYTNRAFELRTNKGATDRIWTFGQSGTLTFPDNTTQTTAYTATAVKGLFSAANNSASGSGGSLSYTNGVFTFTPALNIAGNAATVTNGVYTTDTGTVTNTMLAGSIANNKLANSSVTVNGTSISLGSSGTITAAADTLTGSTLASGVTASSLTSVGTLNGLTVNSSSAGTALTITATTAAPYGGSATWKFIGNGNIGGVPAWIEFPNGSVQTTAYTGNAATVTNGVYTTDTGTVTNTMLAGSIANAKLANSSITVNGTSISLGGSATITADASTLTGTTLNSTVVTSSLTSVGTLTSLTISGAASITYAPGTPTGAGIQLTGKDTQGGTGYFDCLRITNTTAGVSNANKTFRMNSTGGIEIINSAYTQNIFNLTDAGVLTVPVPIHIAGKQAVNGPAFRAFIAVGQTITSGSQQKVTFGSETFDTNSNFASSRFAPTVEGYYQLNATVRIGGGSSTGECMMTIWKNGSEYARGTNESGTEQGASFYSMQVSDIAYANGTTDYFEIYIQQTSGGNKDTTAGTNISYFSGCMIRGA